MPNRRTKMPPQLLAGARDWTQRIKAEGKGVERPTGCPALDFELFCALFHQRPAAPISYTVE